MLRLISLLFLIDIAASESAFGTLKRNAPKAFDIQKHERVHIPESSLSSRSLSQTQLTGEILQDLPPVQSSTSSRTCSSTLTVTEDDSVKVVDDISIKRHQPDSLTSIRKSPDASSEANIIIPKNNQQSSAVTILLISTFLLVLSAALVSISPAPFLISKLGIMKATVTLSMLSSTAAATEIMFSPVMGSILDSVGRKPAICLSAMTLTVTNGIAALYPSVQSICAAKFISMIAIAHFFVSSQAILGDVSRSSSSSSSSSTEKISQAMGAQFALLNCAFLVGSLGAGRLSSNSFSIRLGYTISASCSFVAALFIYLKMPETLSPEEKTPFNVHQTFKKILEAPFSCTKLLFNHGKQMRILALIMLLQTMPMFMGDVLQLYSTDEWKLDGLNFSNMIAVMCLAGIVGNTAASKVVIRRLGMKLFMGVATLSSLFFPLGVCLGYKYALAGSCIGCLGSAQMLGTTAALMSQGSKSDMKQGELAGERASFMAMLKVVGPLMYALIYQRGQKIGVSYLPFMFNAFIGLMAFTLVQCHLL